MMLMSKKATLIILVACIFTVFACSTEEHVAIEVDQSRYENTESTVTINEELAREADLISESFGLMPEFDEGELFDRQHDTVILGQVTKIRPSVVTVDWDYEEEEDRARVNIHTDMIIKVNKILRGNQELEDMEIAVRRIGGVAEHDGVVYAYISSDYHYALEEEIILFLSNAELKNATQIPSGIKNENYFIVSASYGKLIEHDGKWTPELYPGVMYSLGQLTEKLE